MTTGEIIVFVYCIFIYIVGTSWFQFGLSWRTVLMFLLSPLSVPYLVYKLATNRL